MKRIGYIYEKICDEDNIRQAIMKASVGKRDRWYVRKVMRHLDETVDTVRQMLLTESYIPSPYKIKRVCDGPRHKERFIFKPNFFPDQIIHWALMLQITEVIQRGMYAYTCGSVPGRGTSYAQAYLRKALDKDFRGTKYCLKMDIKKFYPSIDKDVMRGLFRVDIKDVRCLRLIDKIVDSVESGLPIGNYTSQWFANYFLQGLDHFIKEKLGVKYYVRYVDDLIVLGANKRKLHRARVEIESFLAGIRLTLKGDWQVFRVDERAIDFLGFRFFRDKTILRKSNALRIRRRMKKIGRKDELNHRDACAVVSYWGWVKCSDSRRFYDQYIKPIVPVGRAKRRISEYAREANCLSNAAGV